VAISNTDGATYVVSLNGGAPRKLADHAAAPDWSPDGTTLAITSSTKEDFLSQLVDVATGKVTTVPDSKGTIGPWFGTPDTLIASSSDFSKLMRFDLKAGKWSDLIRSPDKFVNWLMTPDGQYLIYQTGGKNPTVYRLRISDGASEFLVSLKDVPVVSSGLSESYDNTIFVTRDIGTQEVYAISVKWP
jgi:dipeptidyl aminopeptidase/acylaminoacyl peptidase